MSGERLNVSAQLRGFAMQIRAQLVGPGSLPDLLGLLETAADRIDELESEIDELDVPSIVKAARNAVLESADEFVVATTGAPAPLRPPADKLIILCATVEALRQMEREYGGGKWRRSV